MTTILIVLNVLLLGLVVVLLVKNKSIAVRSEKMFSDLEDIDLIEFQQNLKSLIEELNKVAGTSIKNMEEKKIETEFAVKTADLRINEIKYLIERNQLKRQAEYKEVINDDVDVPTPKEQPQAAIKSVSEQNKQPKMIFTGMDESIDPPLQPENKMPVKDKYQHINALIKNGMSIEEIAKVTGLTRGEIELVRNIKR